MNGIYLDYNATTPCDPQVTATMLPYFNEIYGNPANGYHRQGRLSAKAIDVARSQVADLIGATEKEIVFTGGATESNNLVIFGLAQSFLAKQRQKIVISAIEHKAVLTPAKRLHEIGFEVAVLPVDGNGQISIEVAREKIDANTLFVSIQSANNEVGTIQPIQEIAELAHANGAFFHTDSAQMVGKLEINAGKLGVDLLSMSSHKLYGPKGIGALYLAGGPKAWPIQPTNFGGGQESGLRPGTSNVPGIVGFGEACRLAKEALPSEAERIRQLRDHLEDGLKRLIPGLRINCSSANRLPNTSSLTFPGIDADALLLNLESVMIGTGSACSSGAIEPSHVLTAIGLNREDAYATVRISLGRFTTKDDNTRAIEEIGKVWKIIN